MIAFVFPGQGSQKRGMGQGLFDQTEYAAVEREVDAIVGYSMRNQCLADPDNRLGDTQYTQPSLYVVNALHYYKAIAAGKRPSYVAGHSLGEYNALLAAGAFDFLTGLRMVKKRGELMAVAKNGGMAAVIGLSGNRITQITTRNGLAALDVANYNSPSQVVVSGPLEDVKRAGPIFEKEGASLYVQLRVSAAFHSRYMTSAANAYADYLTTVQFRAPEVPVMSNVTGLPYSAESGPAAIRLSLAKQINSSVLWTQSVRYLLSKGVEEFVELGPGDVLTKLILQTRREKA